MLDFYRRTMVYSSNINLEVEEHESDLFPSTYIGSQNNDYCHLTTPPRIAGMLKVSPVDQLPIP